MDNDDNFLWIVTAGVLSLFVTGCVIYGYHRVVNALNDPTVIQPYQSNQATTDGHASTEFQRHDP